MNIIYFSGNGNTKYCMKLLSSALGNGKIESIENENAIQLIKESDEFILAYPVHFSNIPFIVKDFIQKNSSLFSGKNIFLIATMGAFSGDGTGCGARLLKKCGANILGGLHLRMPDTVADVKLLKKSSEENKAIIKNTEEKISAISKMLQNKKYHHEGLHFYNQLAGLFGQRLWFMNAAKKHRHDFKVAAEKCSGCGFCQKQCPTHSIQIENKVAKLTGSNCTICYRCVNSCPRQAITIIGKDIFGQYLFGKY
jgi:ferredoxin